MGHLSEEEKTLLKILGKLKVFGKIESCCLSFTMGSEHP